MWKTLDKRLAAFLLDEASIEGTNSLKITHEVIANHLGSHREVCLLYTSFGTERTAMSTLLVLNISGSSLMSWMRMPEMSVPTTSGRTS